MKIEIGQIHLLLQEKMGTSATVVVHDFHISLTDLETMVHFDEMLS
jgi:hypothetical protein